MMLETSLKNKQTKPKRDMLPAISTAEELASLQPWHGVMQ